MSSRRKDRNKQPLREQAVPQNPPHGGEQHRPEFKDRPYWLIGAFVIATLLGNGAYWKWKETKLTTVVQTTGLRKSQNELYQRVIELSMEYGKTRDEHEKSHSSSANNKMITLSKQLELIKADFLILEEQLAQLEGRQPRPILLEFIPPSAPKGLRIEQ